MIINKHYNTRFQKEKSFVIYHGFIIEFCLFKFFLFYS
jgi:hypothetical protein